MFKNVTKRMLSLLLVISMIMGIFSMTVFAVETTTTYTVIFNPNSGSVTPTSKEVQENEKYGELPTPVLQDANFLGWFKNKLSARAHASRTDDYYNHYVIRISPHTSLNNHNYTHYLHYGDVLVFDVTITDDDAEITGLDLNDRQVPTTDYKISADKKHIHGVIEITNIYDIYYVLDFIDIHLSDAVPDYTINEFSIYQSKVIENSIVENENHMLIAGWDVVLPTICTLRVNLGEGLGRIDVVAEGEKPNPDSAQSYFENLYVGSKRVLGAKADDDYQFVNWTISGDDTFSNTEPQIEITVSGDVEYLANFELIEYNVTYDSNGGSGDMSGETAKYYIFPSCEFTAPENKTFDKWEVNGTKYKVGDTLELTEDITVKATWKAKSTGGGSSSLSYKLTTKTENATIIPDLSSVRKGTTQEFKFTAKEGYEITDVLVDGKSVGAVDNYTLENVKEQHTIEIKTQKIKLDESGDSKIDSTKPADKFKDVKPSDWFYDNVNYVVENGLFNGITETTFGPNMNLTRGMLVTVLYRLSGATETSKSDFEDVGKDMYYSSPIAWASKNGYVNGIGNNKFNPDENITREDLATIIYRYVKAQGKGFTGAWMFLLDYEDRNEISEYAYEPICWLTMNGVMTGKEGNRIAPKELATRAETAKIVQMVDELLK